MVKQFSLTKLMLALAITLQVSTVFTGNKAFNNYLYNLYEKTGCSDSIDCTFTLKNLLNFNSMAFFSTYYNPHKEIKKKEKVEHTDYYYKNCIFPKNTDGANLANKIYYKIYKKIHLPMEDFLSKLCENLDKLLELRTDEQKKDASEKWNEARSPNS